MSSKSILAQTNVSLDLETLGTTPGSIILTIGACTFDEKYKFYEKINIEDSAAWAFTEDRETSKWWSEQRPDVKEEAFSGELLVPEALGMFSDWFKSLPGDIKEKNIWGNGALFDIAILAKAYELVNMEKPWHYRGEMCLRTLRRILPHVEAPPFQGREHVAIDDAVNQARHAQLLLSMI